MLAVHDRLLAEHGGSSGIRDEALLESALARPENLLAYGNPTLFDLAAAYACGTIKNHPFVDGNKRAGFMAAYVFLGSNNIEFIAEEADVVQQTFAVAAGELNEGGYAKWMEQHSVKPRKTRK